MNPNGTERQIYQGEINVIEKFISSSMIWTNAALFCGVILMAFQFASSCYKRVTDVFCRLGVQASDPT